MSAVEQEQAHTLINHREFPAPLSAIERDEYDVVIIGAGPAGMHLNFLGISRAWTESLIGA